MVEARRAWGPSMTPSLGGGLRIRKSEAVLSVGLPWEQAFAHLLAQPILSVCIICMYLQDLVMIGWLAGYLPWGECRAFSTLYHLLQSKLPQLTSDRDK